MFNRREMLLSTAGALSLPFGSMSAARTNETFESFHSRLPQEPWLKLYAGVHQEDTGVVSCQTEGDWPDELVGALYRNGPGRMELNGRRYQHWFDGDGLIQKWSIERNRKINYRARLVRTKKFEFDETQGKLSLVGFGTNSDDAWPGTGPDALNVGNISVLKRDRELWALWEGGSAWRIDPETLATRSMLSLSSETEGLPFSAHPRVEPNGTVWNFGYVSHMEALVIWRLDVGHAKPKVWLINHSPITMAHDFVITANHLIVPLPPFHYEHERRFEGSFLDAHVWHADRSLELLVMNKNDPTNRFIAELPSQWLFHYSNAWEDSDGFIRFEGISYQDPSLMLGAFRQVMHGELPTHNTESKLVQFKIDTAKRSAQIEDIDLNASSCEFPSIDRRMTGSRHDWMTMLVHDNSTSVATRLGLLNGVARFNVNSGNMTTYSYPKEEIPEEHLFVPRSNRSGENEGWLIGTSLDYRKEKTHLNLFELESRTPQLIARATLSRLMPLGLHGQFVPA